MCNQAKTQNDIANVLQVLIGLLQKLAGFFDSLSAPAAQALNPCEQGLVDGIKAECLRLLTTMPGYVQSYLQCRLGIVVPSRQTQAQASLAGLGALLTLLPELLKYLPQLLALWKQLQESGLLGQLPGAPAGPTQPVMPTDYSPNPIQRCS